LTLYVDEIIWDDLCGFRQTDELLITSATKRRTEQLGETFLTQKEKLKTGNEIIYISYKIVVSGEYFIIWRS